jgi:hypothetical protein
MSLFHKTCLKTLAFVALYFSCATLMRADPISLANIDSGWYSLEVSHTPGNKNYIAGTSFQTGGELHYRNFFVFDLSGVTGTVTSAQIQLFTYVSDSLPGTYTLYDVVTPISILQTTVGIDPAIYDDLGTGVSYGSITISSENNFSIITFDLNSAAIAALQSNSGSLFAVGGHFDGRGVVFGGSDFDIRNRIILQTSNGTIPEPSTLFLLGAGLAGVVLKMGKRRKAT